MTDFNQELNHRLAELREQGLSRALNRVESTQGTHLRVGGQTYLNFSSNDYLGLANHPALKEAARQAVAEFGTGSGASRLLCGSLAPHHQLEEALAEFKSTEAALTFSSGYATALGAICALVDKSDVIVIDRLVHASIVDAARLCGAKLRVFAHNDLTGLERILKWADRKLRNTNHGLRPSRILIVTESVFSMDGDRAPLRELVELKDRYGAWLMVDEAHATGLYGKNRRGLAEESGVAGRIEIQMGTLGKAVGAAGGYVCGSRTLVDYLVNRARSFIYSTAPVPAAAAAATAGIRFIQSQSGLERCAELWRRVHEMSAGSTSSAIIPWIVGAEAEAAAAAEALRQRGIFVPAIRYPTVPRGQARLRITVTAAHTAEDIAALVSALASIGHQPSFIPNV